MSNETSTVNREGKAGAMSPNPNRSNRRTRTAAAACAVVAVVAALFTPPVVSVAGTGGADAVGILYGENSRYCEVANMAIQKRHSNTGAPIAGFTFTVYADPGVGIKRGLYDQGHKVSDVMDRDLWTRTFNQHADRAFTATPFGQMYKAAMLRLNETQGLGKENGGRAGNGGTGTAHENANPGSTSETNQGGSVVVAGTYSGMIYTVNDWETVFYPADIRNVTDTTARSTAMRSWVTTPGKIVGTGANRTGSWSVDGYAKRVKLKLDAIGKVGYVDYKATSPKHPLLLLTGPIVSGMQFTQDSVGEQYRFAYDQYTNVKAAVRAAGFPNATWAVDGTPTFGTFSATAQNWDAFVTAYEKIIDRDRFPYGIQPADYELVKNVAGEDAVLAANEAAHRAVGATFVDDGAGEGVLQLVTDADGRVEYTVFGRLTERTSGHPTKGNCSALQTWVEETGRPAAYIPDVESYSVVPRDLVLEEGFIQTLTLPSTPK